MNVIVDDDDELYLKSSNIFVYSDNIVSRSRSFFFFFYKDLNIGFYREHHLLYGLYGGI